MKPYPDFGLNRATVPFFRRLRPINGKMLTLPIVATINPKPTRKTKGIPSDLTAATVTPPMITSVRVTEPSLV